LRCAAQAAEQAGGDDQWHGQLHDRHAQVAQAGVQAQRIAQLGLGVEETDVGHRAGKVAAAQPAQQRQRDHRFIGRRGVLHREADAQRRHSQAGGGQGGETSAADHRHRERIEDAQRGTAQRGQRRQPEQLVG